MSRVAFDWWPDGLMWLLVLELVVLGVMAASRVMAKFLGKTDPRDFFVIFYRTFWQAMQKPTLYPVPINYEPVIPKKPESAAPVEDEDMDEDDLEALFAADRRDGDEATTPVEEDAGPAELLVKLHGPRKKEGVLSVEDNQLEVQVACDPDSGRANPSVLDLLTRVLKVERHQLSIVRGQASGTKVIRLVGQTQSELRDKLGEASTAIIASSQTSVGDDDDDAKLGFRD
jgi:uncharacterized protein YggU (UPF0235/DUF167 family)